MKKTSIVLLAAFLVFSFGMVVSVPALFAQNEVKVGVPNSLTGRHAPFGQHMKRAVDMAAEEINAAGGINGNKIKLVVEDEQAKKEEAINVFKKFIFQDKVLAIFGPTLSNSAFASDPFANAQKIQYDGQYFRRDIGFDL